MNPWDILAWVGAVSASLVVAALTVTIVAAAIRSIRNPRTRDNHPSPLRSVK